MDVIPPTLDEIRALRDSLVEDIVVTPVLRCPAIEARLGNGTEIWGKLEFLQRTGTFKARGALSNLLRLDDDQLEAGVTAVSAGNHAIATAFAANAVGTTARLVMLGSANPMRIEICKSYGAEVIIVDDCTRGVRSREADRTGGRPVFRAPVRGSRRGNGNGHAWRRDLRAGPGFRRRARACRRRRAHGRGIERGQAAPS